MKWVLAVIPLLISLFFVVFGCGCIWLGRRELRRLPAGWTRLTGVVTGIASEAVPDRPGRARRELTVSYRYSDSSGYEHTGRGPLLSQNTTMTGSSIGVLVDPMDPSRSVPLSAPRALFQVMLVAGVGVGLLGLINLAREVAGLL